jgi:TnpA family transposase
MSLPCARLLGFRFAPRIRDWMQLVLSVQAGRIPASTLIRQLSHRSDVNTLSRFAEQLGNVDRTIFLLEWISNQPMRQEVTAMTNKVEGYRSFSKWLRFGGEVVAENDDPNKHQKYLRYNDLLASAVILQNVIDMSQIIADLRREGWMITEEDLSLLSPHRNGRDHRPPLASDAYQKRLGVPPGPPHELRRKASESAHPFQSGLLH